MIMANLEMLPTLGPGGLINVIVEAARGMAVKCQYDPQLETFVLGKPLPHGLVYPFDWGFIPSTRGEDRDPLDAMVLHDAACPVGCLIRCQPVAVLRLLQREKGETKRNDRLLLRPAADKAIKDQNPLTTRLKRELEQFFEATTLGSGKTLTFEGWRGPKQVEAEVRKGAIATPN